MTTSIYCTLYKNFLTENSKAQYTVTFNYLWIHPHLKHLSLLSEICGRKFYYEESRFFSFKSTTFLPVEIMNTVNMYNATRKSQTNTLHTSHHYSGQWLKCLHQHVLALILISTLSYSNKLGNLNSKLVSSTVLCIFIMKESAFVSKSF